MNFNSLMISFILFNLCSIGLSEKDNPNDDWCPNNVKCANSANCKPCDRKFLFVLAQGRSGSTTMKNMINELPGVRLSGEIGGTVQRLQDLFSYVLDDINFVKGRVNFKGSWGHHEFTSQSLSCTAQNFFETINPPGENDDPADIIGFKEIRVDSVETFEFLLKHFPCSRFIFNVRSDPVGLLRSQRSNFKDGVKSKNDDYVEKTSSELPALYRKFYNMVGSQRGFHMDMVDWATDPKKFDELAVWLGFEGCNYPSILHDNTGNGWEIDQRNFDLGAKCRYAARSS